MDLAAIYREERPRALATLVRLLGDLDLAEDALQEGFAIALERWPREGVPHNALAWLVSTARNRAIDRLRRVATLAGKRDEIAALQPAAVEPHDGLDEEPLVDDRLRLIFTCCHPALALDAQVALTLKTLCGLSVEEIARAFLASPSTMAQRLVRAKAKIRGARIPYEVPGPDRLADRLEGVLRVVYLVFTEGYAPTAGPDPIRTELCEEAIRLARLLAALMPGEPEVRAVLALTLLQDSRRRARFDAAGELVTLEEQDRSLWDRDRIDEGVGLAESSLRQGGAGFYTVQAAIAALHARATTAAETDWTQIAALYALLLRVHPSPVIALNHAAAVGMAYGPDRGLRLMEELERRGELEAYHLLPAARADLLRRLGRAREAADQYALALRHVGTAAERRYLDRRRLEMLTAAE